ncbi:MAG: S24 family peptidase [Halobacteriovoraceae bacterium]|nr:S24 family peptidase [Halobacteriovoraceae bacterium]
MHVVKLKHTARAACGLFGISEDHLENYLSLDERFVKNKASTYFFEAEGDSMLPLIMPKDVLIVDRSIRPCNNQIVIAHFEGSMICKRFFHRGDHVVLHSDNTTTRPIIIADGELEIFGVVVGVARHFK